MNFTELKNDGLKREYEVVLPANDVDNKVVSRLREVGAKVKVKGFRPGKVPLNVLERQYGESVRAEVLQEAVAESSGRLFSENGFAPALKPDIQIKSDINKGSDIKYNISFEIFPDVPNDIAMDKISLVRHVVKVSDKDLEEATERLRDAKASFKPPKKARASKKGDVVVIDFVGKVDGEEFEGGSAKGFNLELGSNSFIPGYEDQLIGVKKGQSKSVEVTFPKDYGKAELAGKPSTFEVKVNDILEKELPEVDDELAKTLGFDSVEKLNEAIKKQIEGDFANVSKTILKKDLFDKLDKQCDFDVPEGMTKLEKESLLESIRQSEGEVKEGSKEEKALQEKSDRLSLRRVRLGLLLTKIGRDNDISVSESEVRQAIFEQAKALRGQEQRIIEFYQQNPEALDRVKGPILEEKVVDFIIGKIQTEDKEASSDELLKMHAEIDKES